MISKAMRSIKSFENSIKIQSDIQYIQILVYFDTLPQKKFVCTFGIWYICFQLAKAKHPKENQFCIALPISFQGFIAVPFVVDMGTTAPPSVR
jgi:hypothetical protein